MISHVRFVNTDIITCIDVCDLHAAILECVEGASNLLVRKRDEPETAAAAWLLCRRCLYIFP